MHGTLIRGASVIATPALTTASGVAVFDIIAPAAHTLSSAKVATALFLVALVPAFLTHVFKPLTHLSAGVMAIDSLGC